ncbi:hypothetical protein [Halobacillus mangrovi]|uniref:hypothetical protein n=1 Tax=Halobacillus mangrovi TaxID=402384 RepID=UPI003D9702C9
MAGNIGSYGSSEKKGSQRLIEEYVNHQPDSLNKQILKASPSLLSFINENKQIIWKSPLKENKYYEYQDDFLDVNYKWNLAKELLKIFWPKNGPKWDGIALVKNDNGQKGLLLVEAKAHTNEMVSKVKATNEKSLEMIKSTIIKVKTVSGSQTPIDPWLHRYYQLANRLAYLYLLNYKLEIPTWLVLVNFVDDQTLKPTPEEEWLNHYQEVYKELDIKPESFLFNRLVTIFPDANEL